MNYPWWNDTQAPDTRPGNYYVTARDYDRYAILAGPFPNDHEGALRAVNAAKEIAVQVDPKAAFYGFGTARLPADYTEPGKLNERLGLPTKEAA